MKKTKAVKNAKLQCECKSSHKVSGAFALLGLFLCGLILGWTLNNPKVYSYFNDNQCEEIAAEAIQIFNINDKSEDDLQRLDELNNLYSKGCPGKLLVIEKTVSVTQPEIGSTCQRIEDLVSKRLYPSDSTESQYHFYNADTYSTLAEFGCPENAERYKALALQELDIASALVVDWGTEQAEIVIDTYKKLDMQKEAQAFLNKLERLTEPAIDFILKMERVINE